MRGEEGEEGGWGEEESYAGGGRSIAGLRLRIDGFTPEKQEIFLETLARTACIRDAARAAGISTTSIDRARRNFPDFDAKCVAALALALPNLEAIAYQRATVGAPEKVIRKGKLVEVRIKPSDAMLRQLLAGAAPEKYGRFAGLERKAKEEKWRQPRSMDEVKGSILKKIDAIHRHRIDVGGYSEGPGGMLVPPGYRMVPEAELARRGWAPPEEDAGPEGETGLEGETGPGEEEAGGAGGGA